MTATTRDGGALVRRTADAPAGLPVNVVVSVGRADLPSWRGCHPNIHPRPGPDEVGRGQVREEPDPDTLRTTVAQLMTEPAFRVRARSVADEIAVQPNARSAVALFESLAA